MRDALKWIGAALAAAFAIVAGVLTLRAWRETDELGNSAVELAKTDRERKEQEAIDARAEAEADARHRSEVREVEARERARRAAADDGGDPNRVLDRHSAGPGIDRDD